MSHFCPFPDSQSLYGYFRDFFYLFLEFLCIDDEAHTVTGLPEPDDRHFLDPIIRSMRLVFLYPANTVVAIHSDLLSSAAAYNLIVFSACLEASCSRSCSSFSL